MEFKLKEKEQKKLRKKNFKVNKEFKFQILMLVISVAVLFLGILTSYISYLKLGIDSMLDLVCFIFGVSLSAVGFQRTFEYLGVVIDYCGSGNNLDYSSYDSDLVSDFKRVSPYVKSMKIIFEDNGVTVSSKRFTKYFNSKNLILGNYLEVAEWCDLFVILLPKDNAVVLTGKFPTSKEIEKYSESGEDSCGYMQKAFELCLSDCFEGFDYSKVSEYVKEKISSEKVIVIKDRSLCDICSSYSTKEDFIDYMKSIGFFTDGETYLIPNGNVNDGMCTNEVSTMLKEDSSENKDVIKPEDVVEKDSRELNKE